MPAWAARTIFLRAMSLHSPGQNCLYFERIVVSFRDSGAAHSEGRSRARFDGIGLRQVLDIGLVQRTGLFVLQRGERSMTMSARTGDSAMFDLPGVGVARADPATARFLSVNQKMCGITGYSEEELLGMTFADITHPEDREEDLARFRRAAESEKPEYQTEKRYVRKDGSVAWVSVDATIVRDEAGEPSHTMAVIQDITRRKRDEERLAQQARLLDLTQDAVFVRDNEDRISFWNRAAEQQYGWTREEALGEIPQELLGTWFPKPLEEIKADLQRDGYWEGELWHTRRDGSTLIASSRLVLERDESGQTLRTLQANTDITERKRAEETLAQSEHRLRAIVETDPECVKVLDKEGSLLEMNRAGLAMIEAGSLDQVRGKPVEEIVVSEHRAAFRALTQRALRGEPGTLQFEIVGLKGTRRWLETHAVPLRDVRGEITGLLGVTRDITERRETEEALRLRDRAVAASQNGILITDPNQPDNPIVYVNPAFESMTGYASEEVLGKNCRFLQGTDYDQPALQELRSALGEVRPCTVVLRNYRKDGALFYNKLSISPVRDEEGSLTGFIGVQENVTERRRAEEELHASLKELADLKFALDESAIVAFTDQRGRITYVNDRFCEISKYSRDELIGQDHRIINSKYHPREFIRNLWRTIAQGRVWRGELRNRAKDGSIYWVDTTIVPFLNERGKPYQYVAIRSEITDRKRSEEELRESNTLLRSVIEGTNDAIYLKDAWGRYLMVNSTAAEVIGRPIEEILGNDDAQLLPPEVARPLMKIDREVMTTGEARKLEESLPVAGAVRTFYSTKAPYRDHRDEVAGVIGVSSDITELKKAEEELREIREAERARLARELHDVVLQDLTYALQTVQSSRSAPADGDDGSDLDDAATALRRSVHGLRGALQDLRTEEESGGSFVRLVESLVELNRRMNPGCEVEFNVDESFSEKLPEKTGKELLRIVQEALANARRHAGARRVSVAAGSSGEKLWVEVSDDGRGFDREEVSAGLGTRGMRERARALGGELRVTSKPGEGTTVRFELESSGKGGKESGEPPAETARILLVDDHASFRQGVASALEPVFEIVGQAGSLVEARAMLAGPSVDVGIFDLGLPDGYGGDLIKELRSANPRAQALVLSASEDRAEIARAVELGAAGILHKSASMDEVVEAVRRLQAGETLLPLEEVVELLRFAGVRREQEYEARQAIARLTDREKEVLALLAEGLDADEISRRLHISAKTERNHVASILAKLGVHSRLQALVFATRHDVVAIGHQPDVGG